MGDHSIKTGKVKKKRKDSNKIQNERGNITTYVTVLHGIISLLRIIIHPQIAFLERNG